MQIYPIHCGIQSKIPTQFLFVINIRELKQSNIRYSNSEQRNSAYNNVYMTFGLLRRLWTRTVYGHSFRRILGLTET